MADRGKKDRTHARLGSKAYSAMTRSMENMLVFDKVKIAPDKKITLLDDVRTKDIREVRKGIKDYKRPTVWRKLLGLDSKKDYDAEYQNIVADVFFKEVPQHVHQEVHVPDFGGVLLFRSHGISKRKEEDVSMLLCIIQAQHPEVMYCPLIPDMVTILTKYLKPSETFSVVSKMIQKGHIPSSDYECRKMSYTMLELLKRHCKPVYQHATTLEVPLLDTFDVWIARIFTSYLPYTCVLRIMDCFIVEGLQTLYRIVITIFQMYTKELLGAKSLEDFKEKMAMIMRTKTNAGELISMAFKIKISKTQIKDINSTREISRMAFHEVQVFSIPHFQDEQTSNMASTATLRRIWMWLPNLLRIEDPKVIYNSEQDGYNMASFLQMIHKKESEKEPIFLFIKGSKMEPVGMFLDWSIKKGSLDQNSFLFELGKEPKHWKLNESKMINKCYKRLRTFIVKRVEEFRKSQRARQKNLQAQQAKDADFKLSFRTSNKTLAQEKDHQQHWSKWLNDTDEEVKTEAPPDYCQHKASKFMTAALRNPEVKDLFDNLDENSTGTLKKPEAMRFFNELIKLIFKGGTLPQKEVDSIAKLGERRMWAKYSLQTKPPVVAWKTLADDEGSTNNQLKGAWFVADARNGVSIGYRDVVGLHLQPGLKVAGTYQTVEFFILL